MSEANFQELTDPDIVEAAREALAMTMEGRGLNEFRALFVALRMIGYLMEMTGARVAMGHAAEQSIRELAGAEAMEGLRAVQCQAFGMKRKGDRDE